MKNTFVIIFLLLLLQNARAQKEANAWVFGKAAGIDFNPPAPVASGSNLFSEEGSASIADSKGNLLIYCDGEVIFNRKRVVMKNGDNISSGKNSTQVSVIIPMRGNGNKYAVFTIASTFIDGGGLWYSIVDMDGDDGNGEVVQKNIPLASDVYEKITAVRHCNKVDTWVTVHAHSSDKYYSFLVTSGGVSSVPVTSFTGYVPPASILTSIGAMKFSSKGNRLAAAYSYTADIVELLDFNNQTGELTNSRVFKANPFAGSLEFYGTYGVEFSPDSKLLYITAANTAPSPGNIYQFDATLTTPAALIASRQIIAQASGGNLIGNLQLAPNNKIYISYSGSDSLGVINNPDVPGAGCNFQRKSVPVGFGPGSFCQLGLPTFDQSFFDPQSVSYNFYRDSTGCTDPVAVFHLNSITGFDSLRWYFGDGTESTIPEPVHIYPGPGLYPVSLIIYRVSCSGNSESVTSNIWVAPSGNFLGPDKTGCPPLNTQIFSYTGAPGGTEFLWNTGATQNTIQTTGPGMYWLQLKYRGCIVADTAFAIQLEEPKVTISGNAEICPGTPLVLNASSPNASTAYVWSNGQTSPSITVNKTGMFTVTASLNGCLAFDTTIVSVGDCPMYVPSAFTPNGDGKNDLFGVLTEFANTQFSFYIYNRYGKPVFKTNTPLKKWDGTFKNVPMEMGAYPYIIRYVNKKGELKFYQGSVMLIR